MIISRPALLVEKRAERSLSFLKNLYLLWIWRRRDPYEFVWYSSKSTFPMRCRPDSLPLCTVLQSWAVVLAGLNIRAYVCSFSFSTILWLWVFRNKQQKHHSPGMQLHSLYYSTWSLSLKWLENSLFYLQRDKSLELLGPAATWAVIRNWSYSVAPVIFTSGAKCKVLSDFCPNFPSTQVDCRSNCQKGKRQSDRSETLL